MDDFFSKNLKAPSDDKNDPQNEKISKKLKARLPKEEPALNQIPTQPLYRLKNSQFTTNDAASEPKPYDSGQKWLSDMGNKGTELFFKALGFQAKAKTGVSGDAFEQEADNVAEKMVSGNSSASVKLDTGTKAIQPKLNKGVADTAVPAEAEAEIMKLQKGGTPLAKSTRDYFEPRFGVDLGNVKIHNGKKADELAEVLNARALTYGNHILFARGEYQPETSEGKKLIAHELTHVQQQGDLIGLRSPVIGSMKDEAVVIAENTPETEEPKETQELQNEEKLDKQKENGKNLAKNNKKNQKGKKKKEKTEKKQDKGKNKAKENQDKSSKKSKAGEKSAGGKKKSAPPQKGKTAKGEEKTGDLKSSDAAIEGKVSSALASPNTHCKTLLGAVEVEKVKISTSMMLLKLGAIKTSINVKKQIQSDVNSQLKAAAKQFNAQRKFVKKGVKDAKKAVKQALYDVADLLEAKGKAAKKDLKLIYQTHEKETEKIVDNNLKEIKNVENQYIGKVDDEIKLQMQQALGKGKVKAASIMDDDPKRAQKQRKAIMEIAEETAEKIGDTKPDFYEAIREQTDSLEDYFEDEGDKVLDVLDTDEIEKAEDQIDEAIDNLVDMLKGEALDEAEKNIDEMGETLLGQIDTLEEESERKTRELGQQAETQVDKSLEAFFKDLDKSASEMGDQLYATASGTADIILANPDADDSAVQDVVKNTTANMALMSQEFTSALQGKDGSIEAALKAEQEKLQLAFGDLNTRIAANQSELENKLKPEDIANGVKDAYSGLGDEVDSLISEVKSGIEDRLVTSRNDLEITYAKAFKQLGKDLDASLNKGLAENKKILTSMQGAMEKAAKEARWAYDNPVKAFFKSAGEWLLAGLAFLGGLVLGVLALVALIVAIIVIVALLLEAGIVGIIILIVAAVALIAMLVIGIGSSFTKYRRRGDSVFMAILRVAGDFTGINKIISGFTDPSLSPFGRGFNIGYGLAELVTIVVGVAKAAKGIKGGTLKAAWKGLKNVFKNPKATFTKIKDAFKGFGKSADDAAKPGYWKRVGGRLKDQYKAVKDEAVSGSKKLKDFFKGKAKGDGKPKPGSLKNKSGDLDEATHKARTQEYPDNTGKVPPTHKKTLTPDELLEKPQNIWGKSPEEIAEIFRKQGYEAVIEQSTKGSKLSIQIRIKGHKQISNIQYHPGGGLHGGSYYKISTSTKGKIKIVDPATYKPTPNEKVTLMDKSGNVLDPKTLQPKAPVTSKMPELNTEDDIRRVVDDIGSNIKQNPLRQAYENDVKALKNLETQLRDKGLSEEIIARRLHKARRDLGIKYKDLSPPLMKQYIYEVNEARYGDKLGPSFDMLMNKYNGNYKKIIEASQRPNPDVNKLLGGFEKWLRSKSTNPKLKGSGNGLSGKIDNLPENSNGAPSNTSGTKNMTTGSNQINNNLGGQFVKVNEAMSSRAADYQSRITGLPKGMCYRLNGVKFDGMSNGVLLDAKSYYSQFVKNGQFQPWWEGADSFILQAQRQLNAAGGAPIQWHFLEKVTADATKNLFQTNGITGIEVLFTP